MDAVGVAVFLPSDTRPLCIVDTANRLIANAARLRWDGLFCRWMAKEQGGVLPSKSTLSNVVGLEHDSMLYNLRHPQSSTILLDFAEACPSLSQEFLLNVVEKIGLPPHVARVARSLYYQHRGVPQMESSQPASTRDARYRHYSLWQPWTASSAGCIATRRTPSSAYMRVARRW